MSGATEQTFSKEDKQMSNSYLKRAQRHSSSGKCKPKPQWGITSHLLKRFHQKRQEKSVGEDMAKRDTLCTLGGNLNVCSRYENSTESLKKLKGEPSHNSAIPLWGIRPKEIKWLSWRRSCTHVLTAALFATVNTWKRPSCPSTEE